MIAILSSDPVLSRMLELELKRGGLHKVEPHAASVWLLDLENPPRPMPKRHTGLSVIGFTGTPTRQSADIYLPLPYDSGELQKLLRQFERQNEQAAPRVRHLPRLLMIDNKKISLSPAEDTILKALIAHRGEVVSEEMLLAAMGGDTTANVVQVHVYRLRKKLSAEKRFLLRTVRGKGYCLEGKIEI